MSMELFGGIEGMNSDVVWVCRVEDDNPWFTLLFSSASASQKALWVMKLSLLEKIVPQSHLYSLVPQVFK